ncbi:hypothetical protein AMATHDRAFT_135764 [Amanita thiersii Skay4041]|uniref:NADP-dependent oxidoreductase domain-containing protein n=1 Tax=Amanita thiersii Skay4041 TaxID=703135 RepID=A0A2A9NXK5_9AGAR|nr:hypothetical protein AMATHDRAFT_135764 [Amanita thiersii Skay4041]
MPAIKHFITLNDGTQVPWLAFGTGTVHYRRDATPVVELALNNGITHLDGAQAYANEESIGAGIKAAGKPRSELYIVTKLNEHTPVKDVRTSLLSSLQKLGVDYVDLFLIHSPHGHNSQGTLPALWKEMEEIKKDGLAKSIGVSNFRVEDLNIVLENAQIKPAVNQIEFHPYVWKAIKPVVELCKEQGIIVASYGGRSSIARLPGGPVDEVLETIRARVEKTHGQPVSAGQILTKWILQKNAIVVMTTTKESRIKEFIDAENVPDLTTEEINAIEDSGSQIHKRIFMRHVFGE